MLINYLYVIVAVAFNFLLGRVYSHSMLYNLSSRRRSRQLASNRPTNDLELTTNGPIDVSNAIRACSPVQFKGAADTFATTADRPGVKVEVSVSRSVDINETSTLKRSDVFSDDVSGIRFKSRLPYL
jgi:hypothetical protein